MAFTAIATSSQGGVKGMRMNTDYVLPGKEHIGMSTAQKHTKKAELIRGICANMSHSCRKAIRLQNELYNTQFRTQKEEKENRYACCMNIVILIEGLMGEAKTIIRANKDLKDILDGVFESVVEKKTKIDVRTELKYPHKIASKLSIGEFQTRRDALLSDADKRFNGSLTDLLGALGRVADIKAPQEVDAILNPR